MRSLQAAESRNVFVRTALCKHNSQSFLALLHGGDKTVLFLLLESDAVARA